MGFNVDKCHQLTVSTKTNSTNTSYNLHGQTLEKVKNAKYLGIEINEKLSWKPHVNAITNKANKSSAFIHRNLKGCSKEVQVHSFNTISRPVLEYAASIWDPHQKGLINQIDMVQRRTARRIKRDFRPTSSASEMVKELKLANLKTRRTVDKTTMLYKIVHGLVDIAAPPGILIQANRSTRGHDKKYLNPFSNTDTYRHSFFPSAIRLWNSLPPDAMKVTTVPAFKSTIEGWYHSHH